MFITLEDAMHLPELKVVKLIAGEKGINRPLQLLHVLEFNEGNSNFVNTGELIFVTGAGLNKGVEDLIGIMKKGINKNAAGMVINIGPYIDKVDQRVIDLADEYSFPVFIIPWNNNLATIIQSVYRYIFKKTYEEDTMEDILKLAIYGDINVNYELYLSKAMTVHFDLTQQYRVVIIKTAQLLSKSLQKHGNQDSVEEMTLALWKRCISNTLQRFNKRCLVLVKPDEAIMIVMGNSAENGQGFMKIIEQLQSKMQADFEYQAVAIGWGNYYDIRNVKKSHKEAILAMTIANKSDTKKIIDFSKLGFLKTLFDIHSLETLIQFRDETVGKLIGYDQQHDTDLMGTLTAYVQTGRNIQQAAEKLYVHSNTIKYRIKKINEILDCNVTNPEDYNTLIFAVEVQLYLEIVLRDGQSIFD